MSCLHFSRKCCFSMVKSLQKSRIIQLSAGIVLELFRIKEYNINIWQYRTKSVWRLCTPSACKFPVIFHKNAREYIQYSLRFLFHLTKNLTTHLSHNLCAVLPLDFFQKHSPLHPAFSDKKYRTPCTEYGICMQQQKAGITAALIPESVCPPASPVLPAVS